MLATPAFAQYPSTPFKSATYRLTASQLLSNGLNAEECDATDDDSSTKAWLQKTFRIN
jgi:hypothetical protein